MKPELVDPIEWKEISNQLDDEFGEGVSKALVGNKVPVAITRGDTKSFYLIPSKWIADIEEDRAPFEIHSIGLRVGDIGKDRFRLSLHILEELAEHTDRILIVSRQGAESFTYGRSILKESVSKLPAHLKRNQRVIVLNKDRQVLGLAALSIDGYRLHRLAPEKLVAKNLVDIGAYLRGA